MEERVLSNLNGQMMENSGMMRQAKIVMTKVTNALVLFRMC